MKKAMINCKKCGNLIDLSESKTFFNMRNKCQVVIEQNKETHKANRRIREQKVGQMSAMHRTIKKLYELMTQEQKDKAFKISQALRDEIKKINK